MIPATRKEEKNNIMKTSLGIDPTLVKKAVFALKKYHVENNSKESNKSTTSLFSKADPIHVQFALSIIPHRSSIRPIRIDIPHPLHKLPHFDDNANDTVDEYGEEIEVCLIVKDSSKDWMKELITRFPKYLKCIKKVLSLTSLRKKHVTYADRRNLLHRFDFFFADDRILPMLAKLLGKNFIKAKKQPVPIKVTRKEALPLAVDKCLRSTFMCINPGSCVNIRAGSTAMSDEKLCANIQAIASNAVRKLPRKWEIVSSILIKTPGSVSLPVYNKTREQLMEITKTTKEDCALISPVDVTYSSHADKKKHPSSYVNQGEKDELKNKTKKQRLFVKSPLVKALIKQKKMDEKNSNAPGKF